MKQKLVIVFVLFVNFMYSQTNNCFLDREFWKSNQSIETIEQKIAEGNNVSALNKNGFDAVVYAILEKAPINVIKHLLSKKGNPVNKLTHDKRTYVFWAAYKGNIELMKYLIDQNARMDLRDSQQYSVLTFAAATGQTNIEIYELCIANGIDIITDKDQNGANALLLLIPNLKDFTLVDYFITKGLNIYDTDNYGNGVFNYTARKGNKEILNQLIKKGIPYKELNKKGGNAMLFASKGTRRGYNPLGFFKYLEDLGIAPNVTNKDGQTPLHNLAYRNNDIKTFEYFLSKNVDVNQRNNNGNTPLLNAAYINKLDVIKLLIKHTKNINSINKKGNSALTHAIKNNTLEVVNFLINKGADVNVVDSKGNHLSYYLMQSYNPKKLDKFKDKLKVLIENGLDVTKPQENGNTLYHLALEISNLELLKLIDKFDVDINAKNKEGITPLHIAAMNAKDDTILKYLLTVGADKTAKTEFEESVYDLAKENELLQKQNIDISFLK